MPPVRISLREGKTEQYRKAVADGVHRAMVEGAAAAEQDRFQIITEHPASGLIYDPTYLGIQRTNDIVMVQIAENPGLRPQDLMINLVEVAWENWSFGNGEAQYTV
ncbi:MAG TPA: tautomerase family protein [Candidatus Acidoferrum sp.]|nr:tautomerase family protein [Candidatus Acidoferrum sp.]